MTTADAIGGYFGLELPPRRDHFHREALRYQSCRAALVAAVESAKPARLLLPWFICDSMVDALRGTTIAVERYAIDESLRIVGDFTLGANDWLLYVNYFGLLDAEVERVLQRFPRERVLIDNAQAFYSPPRDCYATLYSPRKFFGVPDGGYLATQQAIAEPAAGDDASASRSAHLMIRLERGAEAAYQDFLAAERTFEGAPPRRMSPLTEALLTSIDYESVRQQRRRNFSQLHHALGASNLLRFDLHPQAVPLCYPYRCERPELREKLIARRIFVAKYWPEVEAAAPRLERELTASILPLPCDQRYGADDMALIIDTIRAR